MSTAVTTALSTALWALQWSGVSIVLVGLGRDRWLRLRRLGRRASLA